MRSSPFCDGHIYVLRDLSTWINAFVINVNLTGVTMLQMTVAYRREGFVDSEHSDRARAAVDA